MLELERTSRPISMYPLAGYASAVAINRRLTGELSARWGKMLA
ncbi:MAG TPA: hypothetical protein VFZ63_08620 [Jiangellaceae bacterium]